MCENVNTRIALRRFCSAAVCAARLRLSSRFVPADLSAEPLEEFIGIESPSPSSSSSSSSSNNETNISKNVLSRQTSMFN